MRYYVLHLFNFLFWIVQFFLIYLINYQMRVKLSVIYFYKLIPIRNLIEFRYHKNKNN